MKCRIFTSQDPYTLEGEINNFLSELPKGSKIIDRLQSHHVMNETTLAISIWYELPDVEDKIERGQKRRR